MQAKIENLETRQTTGETRESPVEETDFLYDYPCHDLEEIEVYIGRVLEIIDLESFNERKRKSPSKFEFRTESDGDFPKSLFSS